MLKKSIDDLLFLAHKFLVFFQAVGLALDVNHGAVVQNAVQDGRGNGNIGKNLVPLRACLIKKFSLLGGNRMILRCHAVVFLLYRLNSGEKSISPIKL